MTRSGGKPASPRLLRFLFAAAICLMVFVGGLLYYVKTASFQTLVRRRVIAELENITGGRVELGSFHAVPFHFQVEVRDLTIHGKEAAGQVPYAHVDRLVAQMKIISMLGAELGFGSLVLDRPTIHLIFYSDGGSNQPEPTIRRDSGTSSIQQLFALSISRLEVRHGALLWNDQKIPLDFSANDIAADLSYSILHQRYDGNLLLGKVDTVVSRYRPLAWTAEAHFSLGENALHMHSLKATSGRSRLEANGYLRDFRDPKVDASYKASMDLSEVAAVLRRSDLRTGSLQVDGQGRWSMQEFSAVGNLLAQKVAYRDENFNLSEVNATAEYLLNPQKLSIRKINGRALGGSITGTVELDNWLKEAVATEAKLSKSKANEAPTGSVQLKIVDVSVSSFDNFVSSTSIPLNRVYLAGTLSGTLDYRWKGFTRNAEAIVGLDVVAPKAPSPGQLPLTAHAKGTYEPRSKQLQIGEFTASTPATEISASGTLSSSATLHLSVSTSDLMEWEPLLALWERGTRAPVKVHGRASFNGTLSGKLPDITIAGNIEAKDFDSLLPATSRNPERQLHWDEMSAGLQMSGRQLVIRNGNIKRGGISVAMDLVANLDRGEFAVDDSFSGHAEMRGVDLAEAVDLAGYNYPVSGTAHVVLSASGTRGHPQANGTIQVMDAEGWGQSVERLDTKLALDGQNLKLSDLRLQHEDGRITGEGNYSFSNHSFVASLTGSDFDVARLTPALPNGLAVSGRLDFTATGHGTLEDPNIVATLHASRLVIDKEKVGDFTLDGNTRGGELLLRGSSQFQDAELNIEGKVGLMHDLPADIELHFSHFDVDSLLRTYLRGRVTGHSALAGEIHVIGPLKIPDQLNVTASLSDFYADVEGIKVRNNGPIQFSISKQQLRIEQFRIIGEGTDLSADGTVNLTGTHEIALKARGQANLHLIQSYNPDFNASGLVAVDTGISGTVSAPTLQGKLEITNGALAYIDLPSALSGINGTLVFNQDRLQVQSLTAHTGGGRVTIGGYVTSYNRQLNFNLTMHQEEVRLRYPPGVSSTSSADLKFVGSPSSSTLSGDVLITKLGVTAGFDFGAYLARNAQATSLPQTNPLLNGIRLDVHVTTTPELQMQTAEIRLSGDADLRLRGTAAKPVLLGRADVIEGEAYFNGTKYRMERGGVSFTSPVSTTPVLDLQASTRVRDYDITLNVTGEVDKLNITYRSEPPLPTADIIALLALGRTREESAQLGNSGQSAFSQEASNAILSEALNATVSSRVQKLFGVSRVKIDPQGQNTETSTTRGPQVTIEQQVASYLTITYSTVVNQASQQIIQVEYNISRNVSIVAVRDQNGVVSFDINFRRRKK